MLCCCYVVLFFFFQAEDGIRDGTVTGVQTCALPILGRAASCTRTQSSFAMRSSRNLSEFDTLSPRCAPPQNTASILSGSLLQSCSPQCRSMGARHTNTRSTRDTAAIASIEWNIIGLPAIGMYCLG